MGLRTYLHLVRRHAKLIAAIAVLCATAALLTSLAATPVYQADAKLLVLAKSDPAGGTASAYEGALLSQQLVDSLVQVLQSRPIAQAALRATPAPIDAGALQRRTDSVARVFIDQMRTLQSGATVRVSLVEPPVRPGAPVKPRTRLNVALGLMLGVMVGIGLAVLREFLDRTVRSPERLEAAAGAPVVGTIPPFNATEVPTAVSDQPRSAAAEAFRKLRTNFSFLGVDRESICCVITSPGAADGKSTVTANLALALAEAGKGGDRRRRPAPALTAPDL